MLQAGQEGRFGLGSLERTGRLLRVALCAHLCGRTAPHSPELLPLPPQEYRGPVGSPVREERRALWG